MSHWKALTPFPTSCAPTDSPLLLFHSPSQPCHLSLVNLSANFASYTPFGAISSWLTKQMQLCRSIHDQYKKKAKETPAKKGKRTKTKERERSGKQAMHNDNDNDDLSNIDVSLENCAPARLIQCKQPMGWLSGTQVPPPATLPSFLTVSSRSAAACLAPLAVAASATSSTGWQHMTRCCQLHPHPTQTHSHTHSLGAHIICAVGFDSFVFVSSSRDAVFFRFRCTFAAQAEGQTQTLNPVVLILRLLWHFICCAQVDPLSFVCAG